MIVKILITVFFAMAGLTVAVMGLMSILDPVGTQMANDANPFATPEPSCFSYFITFFGLGLCVLSMKIGFKNVS